MATTITALRGPVLGFHYTSKSSSDVAKMNYEPDALIVMKDKTIIDYGPVKEIKKRIVKDIPLIKFTNCRIIRSVVK